MNFNTSGLRALLFDLDGTLIDSREDIADTSNALRVSMGLPRLSLEVVGSYIGDGIEALVRKLLPDASGTQIQEGTEEFRKTYLENCVVHTRLYEGVHETLSALASRGYRMAVVTNKPERISIRILDLLGVGSFLGCVIGGNTCKNKKPHPEPLEEACRRLGVPVAEACMIGDSRVDIEAGKNAAMPSLGILGGIGDEAMLRRAEPVLLLDNFGELKSIFKGES